MISIVLYGRNDNYGYNLHKRAALSLNCMAEVLTDPSDEILFVDYNTPDDFPTFPEAIQDTLTSRARELLRIFRVRPHIHERFKSKTRLLALEPIARNVAVRRSAPSSRWILSTNTDMIYVPLRGRSLSKIAGRLAPGFYHAPRLEIPEALWESLDRHRPRSVISTVRKWGSTLHLNEIVLGSNFIRYDGPGDFQLLLRSDLFANYGFDEEMLLGWHVDSNIAARMRLKYGTVGDLGKRIYGYHCDHTRQVTPAHSHLRVQNDWRRFVDEISRSDVPGQAESWGCPADAIDEIRLPSNPASVYVQALRAVIGKPLRTPKVSTYTGETYNKVDYDPRHLLPFLADMFVPMRRTCNVAWYGARRETLGLFAGVWEALHFVGKILVDSADLRPDVSSGAVSLIAPPDVIDNADVFIFDFGGLPKPNGSLVGEGVSADLRRSLWRVVRAEQRRISDGATPRRIIALNAINNEYENLVCNVVAAAATPFSTHMRHGFVFAAPVESQAWLPLLSTGEAGVRLGDQIRSIPTEIGWVAYGPRRVVNAGAYLLSVDLELLLEEPTPAKEEPCVFIEVRAGVELLAVQLLSYGELGNQSHRIAFVVTERIDEQIALLETRIAVLRPIAIAIRAVTIELSSTRPVDDTIPVALRVSNWLPFLRLGPLGRWNKMGVCARVGEPGSVVYGPYWSLPPGRYEMIVHLECGDRAPVSKSMVRADVAGNNQRLAVGNFHLGSLADLGEGTQRLLRLPFEVGDTGPERSAIETRIFSSGEESFRICALSVNPLAARQQEAQDLLPFLLTGGTGERVDGELRNRESGVGFAAYSQSITVEPGSYKLSVEVAAEADDNPCPSESRPFAIVLIKLWSELLGVVAITPQTSQSEHQIEFVVPARVDSRPKVELFVQATAGVAFTLRKLFLEPLASETQSTEEGLVDQLEDWIPFLQVGRSALVELNGISVSEGVEEYVVWGPYWTLRAGHYELIVSIVPQSSTPDGRPIISIDVNGEDGRHRFAEHQWHLGRFQFGSDEAAVDLRLPFSLTPDLPFALRTIETRLHTTGDGSFHISSLRVRKTGNDSPHDWFPYLTADECGIHTATEIRNMPGRIGYIAVTPTMRIESGRYKVTADLTAVGAECIGNDDQVAMEIWSGSGIVAIKACGVKKLESLEFAATQQMAAVGVKLRIRALTPNAFSIRAISVERVSKAIAATPATAVVYVEDWLPFLQIGRGVQTVADGLVVGESMVGYAVWGPYWNLPAGRYELIATIVPDSRKPRGRPTFVIDVASEGGLRRFARWKWRLRQTQSANATNAEHRLPFVVPADLSAESRTIETRIYSAGTGSFRVRSLTVRARSYVTMRETFLIQSLENLFLGLIRKLKPVLHRRAPRLFQKLKARYGLSNFVK